MSTASQIVYGGGWKSTPVERLKVKAWIALILAIGLGSVSILSMDSAWLYLSIPAGLSLMVSVVLFFRERPLECESFSDVAREDPSKIQGRSGGMYGYDAERDTPPNGGPATSVETPNAPAGPPSVSGSINDYEPPRTT